MPIRFSSECRHCGLPIEPTEPMGAWIHTRLSIYCPGGGNWFTATPTITVTPLMDAHQSPDPDPLCECGHYIRLHAHHAGCTQCDCRPTRGES